MSAPAPDVVLFVDWRGGGYNHKPIQWVARIFGRDEYGMRKLIWHCDRHHPDLTHPSKDEARTCGQAALDRQGIAP